MLVQKYEIFTDFNFFRGTHTIVGDKIDYKAKLHLLELFTFHQEYKGEI